MSTSSWALINISPESRASDDATILDVGAGLGPGVGLRVGSFVGLLVGDGVGS